MIDTCRIRLAGDDDLIAVLSVHARRDPGRVPPKRASADEERTWARMMATADLAICLAEVDGQAVGTATVMTMPNVTYDCAPTAFIEAVVVAHEHRRRGFATALIQRLLVDARAGGCNKVQLLSHKQHAEDGAYDLYTHLGFKPEAEGFRLYLQRMPAAVKPSSATRGCAVPTRNGRLHCRDREPLGGSVEPAESRPACATASEYQYWRLRPDNVAAVDGPAGWTPADKARLCEPGWVEGWDTPLLTLSPYQEWGDFLGVTGAPAICTAPLRELLESRRGPDDAVQWLPVQVVRGEEAVRDYWMLRLPELLLDEVLDEDRTVYTQTGVMKAVLDYRKTRGRHLIRYPYINQPSTIVSSAVRAGVLAGGFTRCTFSPVPSTHREVR